MELRMYLEILRRRRLLIVAVTVIVAAVAGITSSLKTSQYTATAQVMLRPGDPTEELNPEKAARSYGDANRYLAGQLNIIRSENVAKAAVEELGGGNTAALLQGVSARQAGTTDIIAISYTDPDPVLASRVANAFAHAYIENRRSTSVAGLERASREIDAKLIEAEQRLASLDQEIAGKTPPPTTTSTTTTTTTTKPPPVAAPTPAAAPPPAAAAAPPPPEPTPPAAPAAPTDTTAPPPAAAAEPAPTTATKPSRTTTTKATGPLDGPAPRAVPFQLIVATGPDVVGAAAPAPGNLEALKAARDAAAVQYASLYSRQQELLITTSLKRGEAELIAAADVPGAPSSPHPKRDLALGTVVGLMLGLGFAFLRDQLDDRLHSREEAEEATHLPVLGELPLDAEGAKRPQVGAHERPKGGLAEATRGLRTSLTFLGVDEPVRRLLVTSPGQGDGKSFVAANLAASYAQAGFRTALVSADLRRPRIESLFPGIAPGPGLSEVIAGLTAEAPSTNGHGEAGLSDAMVAMALRPTHIDGLLLLPTGKLPPNPAELLASKRATAVLESLSRQVDVVIIDSPPILAVTDAAVLAPNTDGVILVAAPWRTRRGALARTAAMLSETGARLVGVVLNQVEGKRESYSYSYYYGAYSRAYTATPDPRYRLPWRRHNGHNGNGNGATADREASAGVRVQ